MLDMKVDRISELPDALLSKILSLLPTKEVVATMVLSKRWLFVWKSVSRLEYSDDMYQDGEEDGRFWRFVYSSLLLHESPVVESFSLKCGQNSGGIDIGLCVRPAVTRCLRELNIEMSTSFTETPVIIPRSLYTGCKMLVTLTLYNAVLANAFSPVSFPSLKTLSLLYMKYPGDEFICKLLSSCPVLEDLFVVRCPGDNVVILAVRAPSLKKFTLHKTSEVYYDYQGLVVDAPSLEFLDIMDHTDGFCVVESSIPKVVSAHLDVAYSHTQELLGSLTSLGQLALCLTTSMDAYLEGKIFIQHQQLKLCTCETKWLDLLMRLLKDSPNLSVVVLESLHGTRTEVPRPRWKEPSHVPKCLLSSLLYFNWRQYEGREEDKEVVKYILRNSCRLRVATFVPESTDGEKNLQMLKELSRLPRGSSICKVGFPVDTPVSKQKGSMVYQGLF